MANPSSMGTAKRYIIVEPCMVNSSLYVSGLRKLFSGTANCVRISSALMPPRRKKRKAVPMMRAPIVSFWIALNQPIMPGGSAQSACSFSGVLKLSHGSSVWT